MTPQEATFFDGAQSSIRYLIMSDFIERVKEIYENTSSLFA